jgi:hypothetical protein
LAGPARRAAGCGGAAPCLARSAAPPGASRVGRLGSPAASIASDQRSARKERWFYMFYKYAPGGPRGVSSGLDYTSRGALLVEPARPRRAPAYQGKEQWWRSGDTGGAVVGHTIA